ncbi:hypothetical protein CKF54_00940 [Psittacicella hinzii]|uniref:DNA adenine methylase n=1 Tax=Psittacicella hinzii TaxID=2028575 RepID=A0A3A1YAT1_9GAMM|nr:DNA adenine methylase [Psittacicella hinzii]RIY34339.1 hypothetical protein CKF54_00940 [Psittacicella hinzii]
MKTYSKAPVPFHGQKRYFLQDLKSFLEKAIGNAKGDGYTIIDLFGGSGLLAHNAKRLYPNARVIYNDFDNYAKEVEKIPVAMQNWLDLKEILKGKTYKHKEKITDSKVLSDIRDYINNQSLKDESSLNFRFLSCWFLFSGRIARDKEEFLYHLNDLYHGIPQKQINPCTGYLEGLEIVQCDFREILNKEEFKKDKVIFLLDPPYLGTNLKGYSQQGREFNYADMLMLMTLIRPPYMLFYINNQLLQIEDLTKKMLEQNLNAKAFRYMQMLHRDVGLNVSASRKESIYYHL